MSKYIAVIPLSAITRISLVEAGDQETMLYRFTSHEVQLVTADLTGTTPVSVTGNVRYLDADTTVLHYLGCNTARAPLDDPAVRRCLSDGINRAHLVSAFLSSHAVPTQFPVSPRSPLYPEGLEELYSLADFSADAAALDLSGRTLTLLVNQENAFKVAVAGQIAEAYTAAGIPVTVEALPWEAYTAALAAGDFDLYYGEVKLSADWDLSELLGTGGALNYGGWADPWTDQLLEAFASAADREAPLEQLCRRLRDQAPLLPIAFKSTSVLVQANVVENLEPTAGEPFYNLAACTIRLRSAEP